MNIASRETTRMVQDVLASGPSEDHKSTRRALEQDDLQDFADLVLTHPGREITVYCWTGFVPNSYRGRCEIEKITYTPCYPHGWIERSWGGAQRSRGEGPTRLIDRRQA